MERPRARKQRLHGGVDELDAACHTAAAKWLADDLAALVAHLRCPTRWRADRCSMRNGGGERSPPPR